MGRLAQNAQQIAAIQEQEPRRDYAVMRCVRAWADLSTCRPIGMTVGPIRVTDIWTWCDRHGLDRDVAEVVIDVIRTLDIERAKQMNAVQEQRRALGK